LEQQIDRFDDHQIRSELERVLRSKDFSGSERHRRFLSYIVEETLAGRADRLKAYNIATTAFSRSADFDPQQDSIVRIEAGRLRRALDHFYLTEGRDHDVQIAIPKGSYVPLFRSAGDGAFSDHPDPPASSAAGHSRRAPRILVLPFEQEGENASVPGFSRGFVRQLIVGLTRFNSIYVYGTETTERLGRQLGDEARPDQIRVDLILSGSISLWDGNFAVDLLLQDTETLRYHWAEKFTRKFEPESIIALRDEVAAIIVQRLAQPYGIIFSWALDDQGGSPQTLDGYRAVIEFYQYIRSFQLDRLRPVRRRLEEAVERDPTFGEGHACLSHLYSQHARFMSSNVEELRRHAERAFHHARQALLLAPNSSHAHHALGLAYWFTGETTRAFESYRTALALNPNDTDLMADLGLRYCQRMEWEKGVPLVEESFRRNPCQSGTYRMALVLYHFSEGQYEEALRQAHLLDAPDVVYQHIAVAACCARLGLNQDAEAAIADLVRIEPDYELRMTSDLASRSIHPKLAHNFISALREAGIGRAERHTGTHRG
jgi:adenylate cyclase